MLCLQKSFTRSSSKKALLLARKSFPTNKSVIAKLSADAAALPLDDDEELFASYSAQEEVDEANERYRNRIQISETSDRGWGVVALKTFTVGELVLKSKALGAIPRDTHTLQKGWDKHVMIDAPGRLINHSCNGNLGLQDNDAGAYDFFARREIREGEELTWDYETTEYEIRGFEKCNCGDALCRGTVGGFKKHGDQIKAQYGMKYIANYLKNKMDS